MDRKGEILILFAAFFFGLTNVLGKIIASQFSISTIYVLVSIVSSVILFLIVSLLGEKPSGQSLRKKNDLIWLVFYSFAGYTVPLYFLLVAYRHGGAAQIGFMLKMDAIFATIFGFVILREKVKAFQLVGMLVMLCGVFLLLGMPGFFPADVFSLSAIVTALFWGMSYGAARKLLHQGYTPFLLSFLKQAISVPFILPLALIDFAISPQPLGMFWLLILFSLFPHVIAHPLLNFGLKRAQTWLAGTLLLTDSVFSALVAFCFLGERLAPNQVLGALTILLGASLVLQIIPKSLSS